MSLAMHSKVCMVWRSRPGKLPTSKGSFVAGEQARRCRQKGTVHPVGERASSNLLQAFLCLQVCLTLILQT